MSEEDIEGRLLHKLALHRNFGHNYLARRDAIKYVPREHAAVADRIISKLIQEGLIMEYKKGACIHLVGERYPEIRQRIDAFLRRSGRA